MQHVSIAFSFTSSAILCAFYQSVICVECIHMGSCVHFVRLYSWGYPVFVTNVPSSATNHCCAMCDNDAQQEAIISHWSCMLSICESARDVKWLNYDAPQSQANYFYARMGADIGLHTGVVTAPIRSQVAEPVHCHAAGRIWLTPRYNANALIIQNLTMHVIPSVISPTKQRKCTLCSTTTAQHKRYQINTIINLTVYMKNSATLYWQPFSIWTISVQIRLFGFNTRT